MKVYVVSLDDFDAEPLFVCADNPTALNAVVDRLREATALPEDAFGIIWDMPVGSDPRFFGVNYQRNAGRLLDMNGPLDGPRETVNGARRWRFDAFEVIE